MFSSTKYKVHRTESIKVENMREKKLYGLVYKINTNKSSIRTVNRSVSILSLMSCYVIVLFFFSFPANKKRLKTKSERTVYNVAPCYLPKEHYICDFSNLNKKN